MKYNITKNLAGAYSVKFNCPGCGVKLSEALKRAGQQDACPECGQAFVIPGTNELAKYEAKQQQQAAEKAELKAAKEAEKERARQEKERQRAEAAEAARMIRVQEEKEKILAERQVAHEQILHASPNLSKPVEPNNVVVTNLELPGWASSVIGITYVLLGAAIGVGLLLFIAGISAAQSAPQEAAAGAIFATLFIAAYVLARSVEKVVRALVGR